MLYGFRLDAVVKLIHVVFLWPIYRYLNFILLIVFLNNRSGQMVPSWRNFVYEEFPCFSFISKYKCVTCLIFINQSLLIEEMKHKSEFEIVRFRALAFQCERD